MLQIKSKVAGSSIETAGSSLQTRHADKGLQITIYVILALQGHVPCTSGTGHTVDETCNQVCETRLQLQ
jgi:hypothetical protein